MEYDETNTFNEDEDLATFSGSHLTPVWLAKRTTNSRVPGTVSAGKFDVLMDMLTNWKHIYFRQQTRQGGR